MPYHDCPVSLCVFQFCNPEQRGYQSAYHCYLGMVLSSIPPSGTPEDLMWLLLLSSPICLPPGLQDDTHGDTKNFGVESTNWEVAFNFNDSGAFSGDPLGTYRTL